MRAIIFTMLLAGVYAAVPEEVPALDGTAMRRTPDGPYRVHGCGGSSAATSSSSSHYAAGTTFTVSSSASSAILDCHGCFASAPTNGALGGCPAELSIGQACNFTCNCGYSLSGVTSCNAGAPSNPATDGGALTAGTCTLGGVSAVACASSASNTTTTASTSASTATSTVTQVYTFASLAAGDYSGSVKGNIQCAYANTVEGGTTWCVAASGPAWTYKSTVSITSTAAARRSAKVTFVLVVATSEKTLDQIKTLVASNSNPANFATALTAVNTASNFTASPGAATVATATFTSSGSGASSLMPSMLALVSALFIAFKHM